MTDGKGITLLVPFTPGISNERDESWTWLFEYWNYQLPKAQIIMGYDTVSESEVPFSKTAAVNLAAAKAQGDIFVILDADAYVSEKLIMHCANEIRYARNNDRNLWFIPYRRFYRLSKYATNKVIASDPKYPLRLGDPPSHGYLDPSHKVSPKYAHHYAAMIMIMPREAFEMVGGMDPRFQGWGGEDISFMRAVDTIYSCHKTCNSPVHHLYHTTIGQGMNRQWIGQTKKMPYAVLGSRYLQAYGDRERMLRLANEWKEIKENLFSR